MASNWLIITTLSITWCGILKVMWAQMICYQKGDCVTSYSNYSCYFWHTPTNKCTGLHPVITRSITVYFIQEVQVWSWSKVCPIMLGQLWLHNLCTTSRSHLVHTVDQMRSDSSCSIALHQQKFILQTCTSQAVEMQCLPTISQCYILHTPTCPTIN